MNASEVLTDIALMRQSSSAFAQALGAALFEVAKLKGEAWLCGQTISSIGNVYEAKRPELMVKSTNFKLGSVSLHLVQGSKYYVRYLPQSSFVNSLLQVSPSDEMEIALLYNGVPLTHRGQFPDTKALVLEVDMGIDPIAGRPVVLIEDSELKGPLFFRHFAPQDLALLHKKVAQTIQVLEGTTIVISGDVHRRIVQAPLGEVIPTF